MAVDLHWCVDFHDDLRDQGTRSVLYRNDKCKAVGSVYAHACIKHYVSQTYEDNIDI